MKRIITGLIALVALATANAQTPISSVNAAGYIKVSIQEGKFYFLQTPFNKFDGSPLTLDDVIGSTLPDGSSVFAWNSVTQVFDPANYIDGLGWLPNLTINRGEGFFVNADVNGPAASYDLFLAGEVPGATSAQSTTLNMGIGFSAVGFPYPVSTTLGTSGLNDSTAEPDSVFMWNSSAQGYDIFNRLDIPGLEWGGAEGTVIAPGAALFVKKAAASAFVAQVPYSWPNN